MSAWARSCISCFGVFAGALEITYYPARPPWFILVVLPQVAAGATVWMARPALDASQIELVVADTGIGIPATELPHIFDMFRQARNVTVRPSGGVGLGLYIVKQFVELLEGVVEVQSRLGLGTTFRVRVPSATSKRQAA